ncbi:P-loop containing nucleoside triphosphate hydrolase protein [Gorgonomyces haynaldii]|nr:P-loop containing nucleoside triphosphate hydrolase protein [Gorgonomyces haynaldii]
MQSLRWKPFKRYQSQVQFRRQMLQFAKIARPEFRLVGAAVGLLFVSSAVTMSVPFSMGTIIDIVMNKFNQKPKEDNGIKSKLQSVSLPTLFGGLAGVFIIGALANTGRVILMRSASERIITRLRNQLFAKVVGQDVSFHDQTRSGELVSRLGRDTVEVAESLTRNVSDGLRSLLMSGVGLGAMFWVNMDLTLTMLAIVPPISFGAVWYGRYLRNISKKTTDASADLSKFAEEKLSNLRTVRAFAQEDKEIHLYQEKAEEVYKLGMKQAYASGAFFGAIGFGGNATILAILYYGGTMVTNGLISVGDLTSFFLYTAYVGGSLMGLSSWYAEFNKGIGASTRLFQLLETQPTIELQPGSKPKITGRVKLENITFSYPTRPDVEILSGLDLEIQAGQSVAIVGHSGSGKSTIAQMLLRFYDPSRGTIYFDDIPMSEIDATYLREQCMGFVGQEPILFAASIKENIRYGYPDATDEQVIAAAKLANAHSFIDEFPEKYDTFVGERGSSLSGGQKQRIAIARALLKNPQILILDEATSALDAQSEYLIGQAMERVTKGRTSITIAHRLSTIQKADLIVMLMDGRVAEKGTFEELTAIPNGHFRELIAKQLS